MKYSLNNSGVAGFKVNAVTLALALSTASSAFSIQAFAGDAMVEDYEKIVVTGQKITRTLQETPASISVFTDEKLEQHNTSEISEVLFETANVHTTSSGGFNIRGIDGFNVSGAGTSALASVYVDGSALPDRLVRNSFSTWDANQIEVYRGPQSTLQGRNSLAGAIIMTTQAPTQEWQGKYRVQLGENGEREAAIAFSGGLIKDELAFRFSGEKTKFDGYNYNVTRNEKPDFTDDELYRLKFLYTPTGLPDFSAQLSYTHATTQAGTTSVDVPAEGNPFDQRVTTNNDPQEVNYETDLINLELRYTINEVWDFTSVTTYADVDAGWDNYDDDAGPLSGGTRYFHENIKTTSQEFRFVFNDDKLSGVVGAYYFDREQPSDFGGVTRISLASAGVSSPFLQAQFGLDQGTADFVVSQYAAFDPAVLNQQSSAHQNITSYALFADVTYEINEQWDIFAGLRWDREEQDNADTQNFSIGNIALMPNAANYPAPLSQLIGGINAQLIANVEAANQIIPVADASFTEFIPKIGVTYRWSDDFTYSFTVQEGYRSGGVGVNTAKAKAYQFEPEFTTNYELSMRSFWLDGDLMLNANAFYIDWQDQQVNVQLSVNTFDAETLNAGQSTVKGFEVEAYYQVTKELELFTSIGQAKSQFEDFKVIIPTAGEPVVYDLSGRSFADAPEWTANLGATYTGDSGVFANVTLNYADGSPADVNPYIRGLHEGDKEFDLQNDGRTIVNMQLGYEWDSIGVYLIGKNVFDREYVSGAAFGTGRRVVRHSLGNPQQFSISLRGTF